MIDLMAIEPHKVSRDLSGYITYIYGEAKTGKTTLATKAGGALLLAFEKGYNALPGVFPVDITSWKDVKDTLKQLKQDNVKAKFKTVIFDTIDIAGTLCEKYICAQNGVSRIGEIPYGQGWTLMKKEFEETVRIITQIGYAVFFISHEKDKEFTRKDGTTYNQTIPSCPTSFNAIAKDMADIYAFAEKYDVDGKSQVRLVLRSPDNSADTGCRFKYIKPIIEMDYKALCEALNKAIDKEAEENGGQFVTDERETYASAATYNYEELIQEFNNLATDYMQADPEYYRPRIEDTVRKYLGPNKKVNETTIQQVELVALILSDLKDFKKN